jgi:hypothetical protein
MILSGGLSDLQQSVFPSASLSSKSSPIIATAAFPGSQFAAADQESTPSAFAAPVQPSKWQQSQQTQATAQQQRQQQQQVPTQQQWQQQPQQQQPPAQQQRQQQRSVTGTTMTLATQQKSSANRDLAPSALPSAPGGEYIIRGQQQPEQQQAPTQQQWQQQPHSQQSGALPSAYSAAPQMNYFSKTKDNSGPTLQQQDSSQQQQPLEEATEVRKSLGSMKANSAKQLAAQSEVKAAALSKDTQKAGALASARAASPKPPILLIHGGAQGGWCWSYPGGDAQRGVVGVLQDAGNVTI